MLPIVPLEYSEDGIGKTMGMSKRRYSWKYRDTVKNTDHVVVMTSSIVSGKKKIYFDGALQTEQQVFLNTNFNYSWPACDHLLSIVPDQDKFMLTIDGISFRRIERTHRRMLLAAGSRQSSRQSPAVDAPVRTSPRLPTGAPESHSPRLPVPRPGALSGNHASSSSQSDKLVKERRNEDAQLQRRNEDAESERTIEYETKLKVALEARQHDDRIGCKMDEKPKQKKEKKHKRSSRSSSTTEIGAKTVATEPGGRMDLPDLLDFAPEIIEAGSSPVFPLSADGFNEKSSSNGVTRRTESYGASQPYGSSDHVLSAILSPVTNGATAHSPPSVFAHPDANVAPVVFGTLVREHDPCIPLASSVFPLHDTSSFQSWADRSLTSHVGCDAKQVSAGFPLEGTMHDPFATIQPCSTVPVCVLRPESAADHAAPTHPFHQGHAGVPTQPFYQ